MRLVTRHSKLLYFLKHLPRREFDWLRFGIGLEARLRGPLAALFGHEVEARSWRAILQLTQLMAAGRVVPGAVVRDVGEQLALSGPTLEDWENFGLEPESGRPPGSNSD
jgi:hypothetical protein